MTQWIQEFAERPRGIVTENQRKHLLGMLDEDPDEKADAIRMRNHRIRRNVRNSLLDFIILAEVNDSNVARVFEDLPRAIADVEEFISSDDEKLENALEGIFEFLYLTLGSRDPDAVSPFMWFLHFGVRSALIRLYAEQGYFAEPNILMRFEPELIVPLDEVKQAYENGEYVSRGEIEALRWSGEIGYNQYQEYISEDLPIEEHAELAKKRKEQREEVALDIDEVLKN